MSKPADSFIHITDIHFWRIVLNPFRLLNKRLLGNANVIIRRRREFAIELTEAYADAVAETGISCAVLTGDFTSTSLPKEFEMARRFLAGLARRGLRLLVLPGNHDVYTFEAARRRSFEALLGEHAPAPGYPARERLTGGTDVILVPEVRPNLLSSRGEVAEVVVEQVSDLLKKCGETVVVAGHYPLLHETGAYRSKWGRRLGNAEALRDCLGSAGRRILYVCGHVHRFSHEADADYPDLEHLSTGAFVRKDLHGSGRGEFSEIRIQEDGFEVIRHLNEGAWRSIPSSPRSAQ